METTWISRFYTLTENDDVQAQSNLGNDVDVEMCYKGENKKRADMMQ